MKISRLSAVGIAIYLCAFAFMIILVLLDRFVPSMLVWVFGAGLVLAAAGNSSRTGQFLNKR